MPEACPYNIKGWPPAYGYVLYAFRGMRRLGVFLPGVPERKGLIGPPACYSQTGDGATGLPQCQGPLQEEVRIQ